MDRRVTLVVVGAVAFLLGAVLTGLAVQLDKTATAAKGNEAAVTLTGTIQLASDAKGRPAYTLTSGLTTYTLKAGPRKLTGAGSPLNQYVGQSVTLTGKLAKGSNVVNVLSVNGTALRGNGAGAGNPGRSQDKAERFRARFGDCFPPGQCKDKSNRGGDENAGDADESEAPEASEAPEGSQAP
jgi:type II secretory pathway pseudopilin PulG